MTWDVVIRNTAAALPPFNDYLLKEYREEQIRQCPDFMEVVFQEAMKLFNGAIKYSHYRILTPEERLRAAFTSGESPTVDILPTELMLVEYFFEFEGRQYSTQVHLPYLVNNAIIIQGTKYYLQLALTDRTFFHIPDGIGIKVLRSPLQFWRSQKLSFTSVKGKHYIEDVITVKAHHGKNKPGKGDLITALLLYLLIEKGFAGTLALFGIEPGHLQFVTMFDRDPDFEYFLIREDAAPETLDSPPDAEKFMLIRKREPGPGLYLKVHKDLLNVSIDEPKTKRRVVASLLYIAQYFRMCPSTIYNDNGALVHHLQHESTVYKIILGKTLYGMKEKEAMASNHSEQHLGSLASYLDPMTKYKLEQIDVHCSDIYDLFAYVFEHIDRGIVTYSPANLYEKRVNIKDLLLGDLVKVVFSKVYASTKHRNQVLTSKDVESLLRMRSRVINKIYNCMAVVKANPSVYNDNWLLAIGGKKVRASHAASSKRGAAGAKRRKRNLLSDVAHRFHPSIAVVESIMNIPNTAPGIGGSINPCCVIDHDGNVRRDRMPWAADAEVVLAYLVNR